ncbi:TPA: hypothetical protein SL561_003175, partial [Pseudomonas aeruginosa]|nr:hypothetical protein [Pseudomonas aeruginosa]
MDEVSRIERARIKAFYKLLVDRLGADVWAERKAAYVKRIRERESKFNIKLPIEPQLFMPPDDDIDWYILASHLAFDVPVSDSAYSSRRVYPYAMAIGAVADQLRNVPNINAVLDKMLANNNQPERQLFELLTAAFYLKNGYEVSFIPENSITWPNGKKKSPDLLVKFGDLEFYVECKRADKQTTYSLSEEEAWASIWAKLSHHMLKAAPWSIIDLTFHDEVADASADEVIKVADLASKAGGGVVRSGSISGKIRAIDKMGLKRHYKDFSVRANCPQQELLVFGDIDSNEKRSIATVGARVIRPGTNNDILNM